ncbi:hypothetical protein BKA93DRAFT_797033 [Sparassis latifolia]|uniref:C3H1-type domain-containing protein n=1 Tax=Sparassis crispa TaxID=139825 RepID=A0A401H6R4_9APHY|nr:hypothetical protein SCP_1801030 [Sparassis crispa]GBE90081.1 hypothetical protein SCP_1801030 [Sparassis crispa]
MASRRDRFKTKLCRNFALGHCPQGSQCKYLHTMAPPMLSPTLPITQFMYPSLNQSEHNIPYRLALPMSPPTVQWMATSPSAHSSEMVPYNWVYSSAPYNPALQAPRTAAVQYRPLSWRTTLCRHFAKNRGWCPLGDDCNYIHDLALADIALEDVRFPSRDNSNGALASGGVGRGKAGTKHSHCWAYVQGLCHVKDCPYLHPLAVHLFVRHTPCLAWPNCQKGVLCPYKHPEPVIPKVHALPVAVESPTHMQPLSPVDSTLPPVYQYNGTTYFPYPPQGPVSPSQLEPSRAWPRTYEPWRQPYIALSQSRNYGHTSPEVRPWRDRPIYEVGPPPAPVSFQPRAYTPPFAPPVQDVIQAAPSSQSALEYQPAVESAGPPITAPHEFPYVPPKNQRSGHARRVSVALKSKEDSDALFLVDPVSSERESWKTHGDRLSHRSWAPSSTTVDPPPTPPSLQLIY